MVARKYVSPGTHTVIFSIFDIGDEQLDSAVFIDNLRVTTDPPERCRSLGLDPFDGTVGFDSENKVQLCKSLDCAKLRVTCNLPGGAPIPCQPFVAGGQPVKKVKRLISKKKQLTIPAARTKTVELKITKKGKGALEAAQKAGKRKLKVQLKTENPVNGTNKTFKAMIRRDPES